MNEKLIIIGANEFQKQLVEKAKKMDYETYVFAWEKGAKAKKSADYFFPISIRNKEKILKKVKEINPDGITSVGSDLAVPTVNYIANELNLIGNSNYSSQVSTNKYKMRKVFSENDIPCPKYEIISNKESLENPDLSFPMIIKPLDRSGSRGVRLVYNMDELRLASNEALEESFVNEFLIEEYFEGKQYSLEMISYNGEHKFIAITEEFFTGPPHFVEKKHVIPGRIEDNILNKVIKIVKEALNVLDIKFGASHAEVRVNNEGEIKIIEVGGRMGGDFRSDLVYLATEYDYLKAVINIAVGKKCNLPLNNESHKVALIKWIFDEKDLIILNDIRESYADKLFRVGEIDRIKDIEITDSSERFGYFIITGKDIQECIDLVQNN